MDRRRRIRMAVAVALLVLPSAPAAAQSPVRTSGSVSGVVVDATTRTPIEHAVVTLEPAGGGLVVDRGAGRAGTGWSVVTDASGAYAFADVVPGTYRLRVERLGYRAVVLDAEVRRPTAARLSVGLTLAPVALAAVEVEESAEPPFRRAAASATDVAEARLALERQRQEAFLTSDARTITAADLVDGVTLGESDVFRALQRLPGVATRDDYTAELWTRGSPWSHTRVTFDGVPLLNPVHAVGIFSGLTPEILGAVFFQPGVRSVSSAGAVDLRTRGGGGDGGVRGTADLSMASARLSLDQRVGERGGWVVSARRSYLDVLDGGLDWVGMDRVALPYAFHDIAARVDVPIGAGAVEASGLWEEDRLFGDVEGVVEATSARWGNAAGRITLTLPLAGSVLRTTAGASRYAAHTWPAGLPERGEVPSWVEPPSDNRVDHVRLAGVLEPSKGGVPAWRLGYDVVSDAVRYRGPEPRHHPVKPDTAGRLDIRARSLTVGVFGERRWTRGAWTVEPGMRVEAGEGRRGDPSVRLAPRIVVRWAPAPDLSFSVAAARTRQTLQGLALAGPSAHPAFHAGQFWVLGGGRAPTLRTDLVTVGAERWLGSGFLASVTAYARRSAGLALPDPSPGPLDGRPLFVTGEGDAWGVDAGVRRIAGRWTTSLGYAYGESNVDAGGMRYPSPADRRHRVDVLLAARVTVGVRAGLAYTAMSGAPYTRAYSRATAQECTLFGFGCSQAGAAVQAPNAQRTPDYRSLDAMVQWDRSFGGLDAGVYVQLRNVLGRDNASTYSGSFVVVRQPPPDRRVAYRRSAHWYDRFEQGLPRVPLLGARIVF